MGDTRDPTKAQKPRRPLPTPTSTPKLTSPVTPVQPTTIHGSQNPPPLPTRSKNVGSGHTRYIPPTTAPPNYDVETAPYREPELVTEEPVTPDENVPELIPQENETWYDNQWQTAPWSTPGQRNEFDSSRSWDNNDDLKWSGNHESMDYWASSYSAKTVPIDGRDEEEEKLWWHPELREKCQRPGPGILPPMLAEMLHDSDHSLFSVSATPPDIKFPDLPPTPHGPTRQSSMDDHSSSSLQVSRPPPPPPPPTPDDVRTAVPHPSAYYCAKENGWVLLLWKSSSVFPPLARSFSKTKHAPFPDQSRRRRTGSCIAEDEQPFGPANKTHHFHVYRKAVDAHHLNPPFHRNEWEKVERVRQLRRTRTIHTEEVDVEMIRGDTDRKMKDEQPEEDEGDLLDLYVCCQCSVYCVASEVIPGVVPGKLFREFVHERREHPPVGKNRETGVCSAVETIIKIIENRLWKGETRMLPVTRKGFQNKLGWSPTIARVFDALGFQSMPHPNPAIPNEHDIALHPPSTDIISPQGKQNRARLLRAWVELSAWITEYQRHFATQLKTHNLHYTWVKVDSVREMYQTAIGAHPDQIPRGELSDSIYAPLKDPCYSLGFTPITYSWELLVFGYLAQCRCDPTNTIEHFTNFYNVVKILQDLGHIPQELQQVVIDERSRFRYTTEDQVNALRALGFGKDGHLGVDFEPDVPEDFIVGAWRDCVRRAWRDTENGVALQRESNDAFRIAAESRGSDELWALWEAGKGKTMTPERAYETLEVPKEVDDAMLITVYIMRVEEQPNQTEKMKEALSIIAEIRDSVRLRQFIESGQDPGEAVVPTRADLPRGLNQLGNTCYLNSLLQYFYTIKELRQAVAPMTSVDLKSLDDDKLTDDELKRHRVGGRLVTRREIARSKKFINQLAELFWQLEYSETAAVTPTIELAKLALVTSRDEEEEEGEKGGTDSSNDTDATLVDDTPSRFPSSDEPSMSPVISPGSVLGKRTRDVEKQLSEMDIDSPTSEGFVIVSSPGQPNFPPLKEEGSSSKNREASCGHDNDDVEMDIDSKGPDEERPPQKRPPLPPRKPTVVSDSAMMFGKQHDVAECMDNCMFQIETALLKFDGLDGFQDGKTSVVKRLFYGKLRQRLTPLSDNPRPCHSIHDKEDLFSHLPVNVASDGVDLYDGLSGYFDDIVEFEGKKTRMELSLIDLPPLLQIQLQRVQFNRETLQQYKSQAYVKFGETICMDRFLDSADPQKKARSKAVQSRLNDCRERIHSLTQGKHAPSTLALTNTVNFLSKQDLITFPDVGDDTIIDLTHEHDLLKLEIEGVSDRIAQLKQELEEIWKDDVEATYELTSVFIHRGSSPSWGHYFFYSRHLPDHPDSWFKYNDSDVSVVSKDEVLADTTGSTANPYLLVFAKRGSEVVDTVKRFDPQSLEAQP